jgi:hypothetical protein
MIRVYYLLQQVWLKIIKIWYFFNIDGSQRNCGNLQDVGERILPIEGNMDMDGE